MPKSPAKSSEIPTRRKPVKVLWFRSSHYEHLTSGNIQPYLWRWFFLESMKTSSQHGREVYSIAFKIHIFTCAKSWVSLFLFWDWKLGSSEKGPRRIIPGWFVLEKRNTLPKNDEISVYLFRGIPQQFHFLNQGAKASIDWVIPLPNQ